MKLSTRPTVRFFAALGAAVQFLGCMAQSTQVSQESVPITPALTNVLTNSPGPTNTLSVSNAVSVSAPTNHAALTKTFGDKLRSGEAALSDAVAGVIRLAEGGVGEEVLLAFVQNHPAAFNLTSEEILYLADLGIPETVISAMIKRSTVAGTLAEKRATPATNAPSVAANGQPAALPPAANQPAVISDVP